MNATKSKAKTITPEPQDDNALPPWFDSAKHSTGTGGIFETATGTLLAHDGLPLSAAMRVHLGLPPLAEPDDAAPEAPAATADEAKTSAAADVQHHTV